MAMYELSNSTVRVNNTIDSKFSVKEGVHQGSVLSPFLFIMVLKAFCREFRSGLPWELLYADDLMIIANSLKELEERYLAWKNNMESKCLRVSIGKTSIMKSSANEGPVFASGKYSSGGCNKGVGRN